MIISIIFLRLNSFFHGIADTFPILALDSTNCLRLDKLHENLSSLKLMPSSPL